MLILLPIVVLLVAGLTMSVLQRIRPSYGFAWLTAALASTFCWLFILLLRLKLPGMIFLAEWQPTTLFVSSPALLLDRYSWPYAFSLATLTLAAILTAPVRTLLRTNPYAWASSLIISALGLLAVQAGNPFTLMLSWTAIDLVELVIYMASAGEGPVNRGAVLSFATRIGGTMIMAWAVITGQTEAGQFTLTGLPLNSGLFVLLAAGLRLGVLPLFLPFSQEVSFPRELGTLLRVVPAASTLALLSRLPASSVPEAWRPFLLAFSTLAALYSGVMWLSARDEIAGRSYWLLGLAAFAIICVIHGDPDGSLAWGTALLLPGGILFLFSARNSRLQALPILGLMGLTGLPFFPSAGGWRGLVGDGLNLEGVFILLAHCLFLLGYARQALRPGESLEPAERWAQAVYPFGLLILVIADIITGIWGWPGSLTPGLWWAGGITTFLAVVIGNLWFQRERIRTALKITENSFNIVLPHWLLPAIGRLFRLEWMYVILGTAFRWTGRLIEGVTSITEGDGGVLWALVLLALLLTFVAQSGVR